ncbi:MAG: 2Fe-2S iron-sulfur cluster-binding protein [Luteibaculaceae bacterium]
MSNRFLPAKITKLTTLTPNSKAITLSTLSTLPFTPGQYINVKVFINKEPHIRSYSICSAPFESGDLTIGVKALPTGTVSKYLGEQVKEGDVIEIEAPAGNFTLSAPLPKNLICVAGGSGITPILSIIKEVLHQEGDTQIHLIYANNNVEEIMFKDTLEVLQQEHPQRFHIVHALSNGSAMNSIPRLNHEILSKEILKITAEPNATKILLCGPEAIMNLSTEVFIQLNFNSAAILRESFTGTVDKESLTQEAFSGETTAKVTIDGVDFTVDVKPGKTLLEAALDHGIDAPYSCMGGVCTSCKAKVTAGEIKMDDEALGLTQDEINEGYVLTCSTVAKSNGVCVNFDV